MATLRIAEEIFRSFPKTLLGVLAFENIQNRGKNDDILAALRSEEARIVERFAGVSVNDHPQIAPWRDAYRKFGAKPKDYPSSIENLVRRALKGHPVPHINLIVDLYNTISLRYIVPVGGEDLDKIEGDVDLTFATENEPPVRLLGEAEARPPRPGEVIYKDRISAICRRWNWKEADRTKFTEETANGFFIMEGLPPLGESILNQAINELASLVQSYCGGTLRKGILSETNSEMILP